MSKNIKHIAVIRLSAMGDVAMTVPVLRAFAQQYPDVKITMVSRPFFKPFFDGIPNLEFFGVDLNGRHKGFPGLFRLFSDLEKRNIDAVADLHNVLRSKVISGLFALSGKKTVTVDKARNEKKALTRAQNKIFRQLTPMPQKYAHVFEVLGFEIDLENPVFPAKPELDYEVLALTGTKTQKWIGVAPFAQHNSKVYPMDLMEKVVFSLAQNDRYKVFLFGGGALEKNILEGFSAQDERIINMAGKANLTQELQLIANLDIMLSMDSGNAHIAAMLGVNVITLWGATHPFTGFAPFGQPFENALVSDRDKYPLLPTSVYGNKKVDGYEDAMRTILPETIIAKIETSLK